MVTVILDCAPPSQLEPSSPKSMSTMQHFGKGIVRVAKNYTKGYSDVQAKVRDATSNDPWGPSGTQMNEIAQMTYNQYVVIFYRIALKSLIHVCCHRNDFVEIMEMLDKRLNDKGKNWRHVFKVRPSSSSVSFITSLTNTLASRSQCWTISSMPDRRM